MKLSFKRNFICIVDKMAAVKEVSPCAISSLKLCDDDLFPNVHIPPPRTKTLATALVYIDTLITWYHHMKEEQIAICITAFVAIRESFVLSLYIMIYLVKTRSPYQPICFNYYVETEKLEKSTIIEPQLPGNSSWTSAAKTLNHKLNKQVL